MKNEQIEIIKNFIKSAEKYTAHNGRVCYRSFGNIDYYFLTCAKLGLEPQTISAGLSYEAENEAVSFDYCEHDLIIHIKKIYIKSLFYGWNEATKQQAQTWAKHLHEGANFKDAALARIKNSLIGLEFEELGLVGV